MEITILIGSLISIRDGNQTTSRVGKIPLHGTSRLRNDSEEIVEIGEGNLKSLFSILLKENIDRISVTEVVEVGEIIGNLNLSRSSRLHSSGIFINILDFIL